MELKRNLVLVLGVLCLVNFVKAARWSHSAMLSPDYRLLWSLGPGPQDITFELQVRTLGYVGFGFSKDGRMAGSDMVVGWVDQGQVYFQVSILVKCPKPTSECYFKVPPLPGYAMMFWFFVLMVKIEKY